MGDKVKLIFSTTEKIVTVEEVNENGFKVTSSLWGDAKGRGDEVRNTHINIGTGKDITIKDLAILIKNVVGFKGGFVFNIEKPDGTMRKVTNVSKLNSLDWKHSIDLEKGVQMMYDWYLKQSNG